MNNNLLVSIVIPTRNSAAFLESCLGHIRSQSYPKIEIIIVDGKSTDNVKDLAKKYKCIFYTYVPRVKEGIFDAPHKRNYGMAKAKGEYVYWLDADMELPKNLITEAVDLCQKDADAVILPEDSFGIGIWAKAKQLERRCYWGDDTVESPRFFKKSVWKSIGGFDLSLGAGGDDIDLMQKLLEKKYITKRTKNIVRHNEGNLSIIKLFKKRFMYGREMTNYLKKRPKSWISSYNPLKGSYFRHWKLFLNNPLEAPFFVVMRIIEYIAGFMGLIYSLIESRSNEVEAKNKEIIIDYSDYTFQYYDTKIPKLLKKYLDKTQYVSLLDLGCGDGSMLFALKKNGYFKGKKIFGIDLSAKSVEFAKKIDAKIHIQVDNAEILRTIGSNSIDFIVSSMVLEHVDDKKMLLAMTRVLKKGATAYVTTIFKKPYGWYFYRRNGKWVMDKTHIREYMKDEELMGLIDNKKYSILETNKSLIWFPAVDFIARRFLTRNRVLFTNNPVFNILRKIMIPVIGYYTWEIILERK